MGKVYLVASGKGGTGKTMFAANLGASYAQKGHSVVIVDMDMGLRNLDLYFGLESRVVYDVYDVMTGVCEIKQAMVRDRRFEELYIIGASPERDKGDLTPLHAKVLCEKLRERFDYVIIDSPSGIDDGLILASAGADEAIIVTIPEYAALRDADIVDRALQKLGIEHRYVILNKVIAEMMSAGYIPRLKEITNILRPELLGIIQFDENINISTNLGLPIVLKDGTYIRRNFDHITERLENSNS
jgi:septum site-determining protein MinD